MQAQSPEQSPPSVVRCWELHVCDLVVYLRAGTSRPERHNGSLALICEPPSIQKQLRQQGGELLFTLQCDLTHLKGSV